MAVYLRGNWYRYKKQIGGVTYHRALKIKRGQEPLLSGRLKQVEDEITALHFGLPLPATGRVRFSGLVAQFLAEKTGLPIHPRYKQILERIQGIIGDKPLNFYLGYPWRKFDEALFAQELKPGSVNRYASALRTVFGYAVRKGLLSANPLADYEYHVTDSRARALSAEEIRRLLDGLQKFQDSALERPHIRKVLRDIVLFGLLTGARLSEILYLRRSYIEGDIAWFPVSRIKHRRRTRNPGPPPKKTRASVTRCARGHRTATAEPGRPRLRLPPFIPEELLSRARVQAAPEGLRHPGFPLPPAAAHLRVPDRDYD